MSPGTRLLVVDVANVVGSRPDGWWRDRAGAARRLLDALAALPGRTVTGPEGGEDDEGDLIVAGVVAVLEGAARAAGLAGPAGPVGGAATGDQDGGGVRVVLAERDGDTAVVACAERAVADGAVPLVVTADRGLRARLPTGARTAGPGWLNALLGR